MVTEWYIDLVPDHLNILNKLTVKLRGKPQPKKGGKGRQINQTTFLLMARLASFELGFCC